MVVEVLSEGKTPPNPALIARGGGGCLLSWTYGASPSLQAPWSREYATAQQNLRRELTPSRRAIRCATRRRTRVSRLVLCVVAAGY